MAVETRSQKRAKLAAEAASKTTIANLGEDELSCILKFVAESGAENLLAAMLVSKMFMKCSKNSSVLNAVEFHDLEVRSGNFPEFRHFNSLISLAAQAGNQAAKYLFARVLLLSCDQTYPSDPSLSKILLAEVKANMGHKDSPVYHYEFIRAFLLRCPPTDPWFIWYPNLMKYGGNFGQKLEKCHSFLSAMRMTSYLLTLAIEQEAENPQSGEPVARNSVQDFVTRFEHLRARVIREFDEAFLGASSA